MRLKPDTPTPNFGDHEGPGHFQIFLQLKFFPHDIFSQKKKKKDEVMQKVKIAKKGNNL